MQQINLYLPEFQPSREPLRANHMLWGMAALAVLLIIVTFFTAQRNKEREAELAKQRAQLEQLKLNVVQLEQQRPTANLADLDAQSVKLMEEVGRREKISNAVGGKNFGNNAGFSTHLAALGRQSLSSISLDAFSLIAGGTYIELAGRTHAVDQIPLYLQRLKSEAVFANAGFGVLNAEPHATAANVFQFSLAKAPGSEASTDYKTAVQLLMEEFASDSAVSQAGSQ